MKTSPRFVLLLLVSLLVASIAGACGSSGGGSGFRAGGSDGSVGDDGPLGQDGMSLFGDGSRSDAPTGQLSISPPNPSITVIYGKQTPTITFTASEGGATVPASFSIDLAQIAGVGASSGVLTPTGHYGGVAHVVATYGGQQASTAVTVTVQLSDNGAPPGFDAGGGTGGNGGVGGSGPGGAVSGSTIGTLTGKTTTDPGLSWLYPYDKTVWPQGLLAPLLQWQVPAGQTFDAVYIHLVEAGFEYKGFFAASPSTPLVNEPILQTAWDTLLYSNQGGPVSVSLVFASGTTAYGPLTETWTVAQGTLTGTVYYNSYGTSLVTNYCAGKSWGGGGTICFGGATLAIKRGATSPVLTAGTNSPSGDDSGCRVCHSVAAGGSSLVTQHGENYYESSAYALTSGNAQTVMAPANSEFAFAGISPDGTYLLSNTGPLPGIGPPAVSGLFAIPSGKAITSTGLAGQGAATPVFSPNAAHIAFNDYTGDKVSLATFDFNASKNAFSNKQKLDTPPTGDTDLFPAFLPTNDAVIFEREVKNVGEFGGTRSGAEGELWWVDLTTHKAAALSVLNGASYLPPGPNGHTAAQDAVLQYEPTLNPVASGGYAWVVFTSRRMYGNVGQIDAFSSDPRGTDLATNVTTKKLWVAAIDLNAKPGTDPSHPAFYLPAQELHACNSRGYWVVDPCEKNGSSCLTGDQCCSGFCEDVDGGFVCGTQPSGCSAVGNKCSTAGDCCGASTGIECIDGFCSMPSPQ